MILTGKAIEASVARGDITIEPFDPSALNPNSYNYRLGATMKRPTVDGDFVTVEIPAEGLLIEPGLVYLGHTCEVLGSRRYAMSLIGRSSIGRLGLFVQVSANLGHLGSCHRWTLELVAAKRFRLYPRMRIGQISFWVNFGQARPYSAGYSAFDLPEPSRHEFGTEEAIRMRTTES